MYSVTALKALVTAASLGLGAGAVTLTVAIQRNPLLFTDAPPAIVDLPAQVRERPPMPLPPMAAVVTIPEVAITATPTKPAAKPRTAPAPAKPEVDDPSADRVIPAPCNHGEYRRIDERQGVRLMCPGQF
jgi:hypothetical protein